MTPTTDARCGAPARRTQGEEGAYLVLYALLAVSIFTMAAVVLDMTSLREDKRAAGLAVDLAVTAGAALLDPASPGTVAAACQQAWEYFRANTDDDTGTEVAPSCATFAAAVCDAATPEVTVSGSVGPYQVEITNPVLGGSPLMRAEAGPGDTPQALNPLIDGSSACERLAMRVVRTRALGFARVAGFETGRVDVHAVARPTAPSSRVPSLLVTDPTACRTLVSANGGELEVGDPGGLPGIVYVGSDASQCGGYVISAVDPVTSTPGRIAAVGAGGVAGVIHSAALLGNSFSSAWDPVDVANGRLSPVPSVPPPVGPSPAAFVTDRFHCTAVGCPPGSDPIGAARAQLGGAGSAAPPGYVPYTAAHLGLVPPASGDICNLQAGDPSPTFPPTNIFVDCEFGFRAGNDVTFPANVVFRNGLEVLDGGCVAVRSSACGGAFVPGNGVLYLRAGDLVKNGGARLILSDTFVHLTASGSGGRFVAPPDAGGMKQLQWTAPVGGPFEDLLLWAESTGTMELGGHGGFTVEGVVYAPNTTKFRLAGLGGGTTAAMQLVAGRIEVADATFRLRPVDGRVVREQRRDVRLIR